MNKTKPLLAVHYGNKKGEDIDIFVISPLVTEYTCLKQGCFDIIDVNQEIAEVMVHNLDPLITEPVLTGTALIGEEKMAEYKKIILATEATPVIVKYLLTKAKLFFSWAKTFFEQNNYQNAINNLSFVASYLFFTQYYSQVKSVATYRELLEYFSGSYLTELHWFAKQKKNPKKEEVEYHLQRCQQLLTSAMAML